MRCMGDIHRVSSTKMQKSSVVFRILFFVYLTSSILFFLYSYTQVDLNLTLSRVSVWQTVQQAFQHIGYYERPLSTTLYIGLLFIFFLLYSIALFSIKKGRLTSRQFWFIVLGMTGILVFAYPAFSYDMFNYMFTAKTILVYHKNPYLVIPLQFTGIEPWVTFMRWTHLPSAYTPLWILFTLPAYALGFGYFLVVLWNIKLLIAGFYLGAIWCIGKILKRLDKNNALLGMAIFALNPLIIIESTVSSHNDILMMTLALFSFYLFLKGRRMSSYFVLALSVAMKLMTIFFIPMYFVKWNRTWALVAIVTGFILVLFQREVLPWYWVWVMPFVALLPNMPELFILSWGISLGLLLRYAPYLYFGDYNDPVPVIRFWVTLVPILLSLIFLLVYRYRKIR